MCIHIYLYIHVLDLMRELLLQQVAVFGGLLCVHAAINCLRVDHLGWLAKISSVWIIGGKLLPPALPSPLPHHSQYVLQDGIGNVEAALLHSLAAL